MQFGDATKLHDGRSDDSVSILTTYRTPLLQAEDVKRAAIQPIWSTSSHFGKGGTSCFYTDVVRRN